MGGRGRHGGFDRAEERDALVLILPLLALLVAFVLVPALSNFYYGSTSWKGFGRPVWTGLANYRRLLADEEFAVALRNTGVLILYIPLATVVPLVLSSVLQGGLKGWKAFRAVLYLPNVLGFVLVGLLLSIVLRGNGALNQGLRAAGLDGLALDWIGSSRTAIHTVGVVNGVWMRVGFGCIYFLAAMAGIDRALYDAASIDGAGWWRTLFSVTLPALRSAVEFWIVLSFIQVFARMFGFIFAFTRGGPGYATVTLEYGIYQKGFADFQMGYASAWAVVLFVFCAVLAVLQVRLMRGRG